VKLTIRLAHCQDPVTGGHGKFVLFFCLCCWDCPAKQKAGRMEI
jgi:hypothetical protein